jgi:hypothetical protein
LDRYRIAIDFVGNREEAEQLYAEFKALCEQKAIWVGSILIPEPIQTQESLK